MKNRTLWIGAIFAMLPTGGFAGQDPTSQAIILSAYDTMRGEEAVTFMLAGTEQRVGQVRAFSLIGYFAPSIDPRTNQPGPPKLEMFEMEGSGRDAVMLRRWVGTGDTFWSYDFRKRQYTAASYEAVVNGAAPISKLVANLTQSTSGPSAYVARLLTEVYGYSQPRFLNWAPGQSSQLTLIGERIQDPIVGTRSYTGSDVRSYFLMGMNDATPRRSVAFQLDPSPTGQFWTLNTIFFAERTAQRVIDWFMTITPGANELPEGAFEPYLATELAGWVPVPAGRKGG